MNSNITSARAAQSIPIQTLEEDRIRDALDYIPADDRELWVRMGMAVKAELGDSGFGIWDQWSQRSDSYSERDALSVWRSFKGGGITVSSLFKEAGDRGYASSTPPRRPDPQDKARREAERAREAEQQAQRYADAAERARKIIADARKATGDHSYERHKNIDLSSVAVVGDWTFFDETTGNHRTESNALLIPVKQKNADGVGKICSVQAIFADGTKKFLSGGQMRDGYLPIGKPKVVDGRETFVIAEGVASAKAIHQATGDCVVAAFSAGNLLSVAKQIRESKPDADIVIFSDRDAENLSQSTGSKAALRAALEVGARVVVPEWVGQKGRDANDIWVGGFTWGRHTVPGKDMLESCVRFATPCHSRAFVELLRECGIETSDLESLRIEGEPQAARDPDEQRAVPVTPARDEQRRRLQQDENARIQEDDGAMIPSRLELDEMLERCVWLAEGEVVAYVTPDRSQFLTFKEFRSLTAESVTVVDVGKEGKAVNKPVPTAKLWQSDTRRKDAMTRTFKAGAGVICADPEGDRAVNLWRPIVRRPATAAIDLFLDHVAYLFENEVERHTFLDWCAHLEQKPGELPHYGWLHIASHTGCGRNWLASVLARVWRGYVAPNVDLPALLDSQYNGSIARRVLAIVDEIQEGGSGNRRHTNRLTALLNAETRLINPKFGRQFQEFNSCRWLVFSNFLNALPIDNTDRRWRVVTHERAPRPAGDYERLYAALADKEFINAVGVFLRERDISGFKPGERPPLNAAKAAAIAASKPMQTTLAEDIRDHWPADIILNDHVAEILADQSDAGYTPAMRRAMEEVGAVAIEDQLKINGRAQRGWILRNTENWRGASKGAQRQEIHRAGVGRMRSAAAVFADAMDDEP